MQRKNSNWLAQLRSSPYVVASLIARSGVFPIRLTVLFGRTPSLTRISTEQNWDGQAPYLAYVRAWILGLVAACLLSLVAAPDAAAFPELQRHGYTNCTACHLSPNGGGVLTEYGRSMSKEVLSTNGNEGEEKLAYFIDSLPKGVYAGGDIRTLYLYRSNPRLEEGKWIIMQADMEAYGSYKDKVFIGGAFGVRERANSPVRAFDPISRRHFLMIKPLGDEYAIRIGRFHTAYGLNIPDHNTVIKRTIGFDQSLENYNLELSYLGETWNLFVSGFIGQPTSKPIDREKGFALRAARALGEKNKVGMSYYYGVKKGVENRHLFGPYAILGFTDHLFLLSEMDFQFTDPDLKTSPKNRGLASYHRLGFEVVQGVIPFISQEDFFTDLRRSSTRVTAHTVGLQWYPRPHWEFVVGYQKQKSSQFNRVYTNMGWVQTHFYF